MSEQIMKPIARRMDDSFKSPLITKDPVVIFPETPKRDNKDQLAAMELHNILNQRHQSHETPPIARSSSHMQLYHDILDVPDIHDLSFPVGAITPPLRASNPMSLDSNFIRDGENQQHSQYKHSRRSRPNQSHQQYQKHRSTELGLFQLSPPITA